MDEIRISMVTPCLNDRARIEATLESVVRQNYKQLQYIVVDGGSTDGTLEIIKKYEKYLAWWGSRPDRGVAHAVNMGFARAEGAVRGCLFCGEHHREGTLYRVNEHFRKGCVWLSGGVAVGASKVRRYQPEAHPEDYARWLETEPVHRAGVFWSREAGIDFGPWYQTYKKVYDYDFFLRIRFGLKTEPVADENVLAEAPERTNREAELARCRKSFLSGRPAMERVVQKRHGTNDKRHGRGAWDEVHDDQRVDAGV